MIEMATRAGIYVENKAGMAGQPEYICQGRGSPRPGGYPEL